MSCADDLTVDDLNNSVATSVLERVSAGAGANANLWPQIDRDRYVSKQCMGAGRISDTSVVGVNLVEPESAPRVIKTWDDRLTEGGVDSGVDDEVCFRFLPFPEAHILTTVYIMAERRSLTLSSSCTSPLSNLSASEPSSSFLHRHPIPTDPAESASTPTSPHVPISQMWKA